MTTGAVTALVALAATTVMSATAGAVTLQEIKDRGYIRIAVANEIPYGYVDPERRTPRAQARTSPRRSSSSSASTPRISSGS